MLAQEIAYRCAQCCLVFGVDAHDATSASTTRARCSDGVPHAVSSARTLVSHKERSCSIV